MASLKPNRLLGVMGSCDGVTEVGGAVVLPRENKSGKLTNSAFAPLIDFEEKNVHLKAWKTKAAPRAALAFPRYGASSSQHVEGFAMLIPPANVKLWTLEIMASLVPVVSWKMLPAANSAQSGKPKNKIKIILLFETIRLENLRILLQKSVFSYRCTWHRPDEG
jgi:hypothetical protein